MARKTKTKGYGNGGIYPDPERPGHYIVKVPGVGKRRAAHREKAEAAYQELLAARDAGLQTDAYAMTLEAFVNLWWAKAIAPRVADGSLAPKTEQDYQRTIESYLLPDWGQVKLRMIDAPFVMGMYRQIRQEYSEAMASRVLTKLHLVFDAARRWKYIKDNPVADARKDLPAYHATERPTLSLDACQRLFAAIEAYRLRDAYYVLLQLGLRIGELCGLQWSDIDWEQRTVTIQRQAQDIRGGLQLRPAPKSKAGKRVLPLPPRLCARLEEAYSTKTSLFVFSNDEGSMLSPAGFTRSFRGGSTGSRIMRGIRQKAELPATTTPHVFRHTLATGLKELGVSEEIRADILGHGTKSITQHYSHTSLRPMRQALTAWEQYLFGKSTAQEATP